MSIAIHSANFTDVIIVFVPHILLNSIHLTCYPYCLTMLSKTEMNKIGENKSPLLLLGLLEMDMAISPSILRKKN